MQRSVWYRRVARAISSTVGRTPYMKCTRTVANKSQNEFYVTTPIYYVNGPPHIGHLYSSVLADTLARAAKMQGKSVVFSTGTDEHGLKIQQSAMKAVDASVTQDVQRVTARCQQYVDSISAQFADMNSKFNICPSDFIRTTEKRHEIVVKWLWKRLAARGAIYLGSYEGWYCQSDEAFVPEAQVGTRREYLASKSISPPLSSAPLSSPTPSDSADLDAKVSMESGQPVEWLKEDNYKFRLAEYAEPLLQWMNGECGAESPVVPDSRKNEVLSWLRSADLGDLSVSRRRDKVPWAIQVPNDDSHSIYVWLDALTNYLTVSADQALLSQYADTGIPDDLDVDILFPHWPAHTHIVGKDILRFHAVYWPAFLLAAGLPLPKRIIAHGHFTVGRQKMSKSAGNVIAPAQLIPPEGAHHVDAIRYFVLREGGLASDGDFSEALLHHRCVAECADTYGNLVSRALTKLLLPDGKLPVPHAIFPATTGSNHASKDATPKMYISEEEQQLSHRLSELTAKVAPLYDASNVAMALDTIVSTVIEANRLFTLAEPWKLAKQVSNPAVALRLTGIMYVMLETIRICSSLLYPAQPTISHQLHQMLGLGDNAGKGLPKPFGGIRPSEYHVRLESKAVLFPKPKSAPLK